MMKRAAGEPAVRAAWRAAVLAVTGALALGAAGARAGGANRVEGIDVAGSGDSRMVRIRTMEEPTFTVFRLSDPMRVVVDISGGDLAAIEGPISVGDGVLGEIATRQFNADGFLIGRVIVGFDRDVAYQVQAEGRSVVIHSGTAPDAAVERAAPPPVAPADRAASERFEKARREADQAAAQAAEERSRAEQAASYAREQQREAERIAAQADRTRAEAEQARQEAERLRSQAQQAIERDRAEADAVARAAEERLRQLQDTAQSVAQTRAEAERVAAEANRARRDAEEAAARAEAQHKRQVAELEEQVARAQKEKQAAEAAWQRARAAKQEAEAAQQAALGAGAAAEKTRAQMTARLAEIAERERQARLAIEQLAGERKAVAQQLSEVTTQKLQVEAKRQEVVTQSRELETKRREMEAQQRAIESHRAKLAREQSEVESRRAELAREQSEVESHRAELARDQSEVESHRAKLVREQSQFESHRAKLAREQSEIEAQRVKLDEERRKLASRWAEVDSRQQRVESERRQLAVLQREIEQTQALVAKERERLDDAQRRVAERTQESVRSKREQRESAKQQAALEAERRRVDEARRSVDEAQHQLEAQQRRLAAARKELEHERAEEQARAGERRAMEEEKRALEQKAQALAALEGKLHRQQQELKAQSVAAAIPVESLVSREPPPVQLASAAAGAAPSKPAVAPPRRARLTRVKRSGEGADAAVLLAVEGTPSWEAQRIDDPPRLVVDLADTDRVARRTTYGVQSPFVRRVRLGDHGSVLRVVLDLTGKELDHEITASAEGILVRLQPRAGEPVRAESAPAETAATPVAAATTIRDVRFTGTPEVARIILDVGPEVIARVDDRSSKSWLLELKGAELPKALERSLDTSAYRSVVRLVSCYQAAGETPTVNVVANLVGQASGRLERRDGALVWEIRGRREPTAVAAAAAPQTAGFAAEAAVLARSTPKQARTGRKRISIDLKDADIINVIRLLAEVSGENIIATEDVRGKITLRLNNVPWDQALDTILKIGGYDVVREHNILRIAPADKIRQEKELELATKRAQEQVERTLIKMITVNYADASEIVAQVKPLLSGRGTVQVDSRTNTIILEDVRSNTARIVELVQRLDRPTPQVLIEARIVEASSNKLHELGIQWGGVAQATDATGNDTGLVFPGEVIASGATNVDNLAVNLPILATPAGAIGITFGSAGGSQVLNLRLTALENTGEGRIISAPRVTTLDNRTAKIAQGVDIPITVVSAAGANTRFIPANLELEVTPHVTNDGSILMKIKASKNEPNFTQRGAQGDPTIEKRTAETEVLVRDNDTTVIGGIYTHNESEVFSKVPFFGDLPIFGWLFKSRRVEDRRSELLVFITPRIINRAESTLQNLQLESGQP